VHVICMYRGSFLEWQIKQSHVSGISCSNLFKVATNQVLDSPTEYVQYGEGFYTVRWQKELDASLQKEAQTLHI